MITRILWILICTVALLPGLTAGADQPDPGELIAQIKTTLKRETPVRVVFRQETLSALTETVSIATGALVLRPDGQLRWDYEAPEPHYFIVLGGRILFVQPRDKQAFLGELEQAYDPRLPLAVLFRDYPLQTYYRCTAARPEGGQEGWRIGMVPIEPNAHVAAVDILTRSDMSIRSVVTSDAIGNKNSYFFDPPILVPGAPPLTLDVPQGFQLLDFNGDPITGGSRPE